MINDNILYDKQIELYVKQMFQLELFECFLKLRYILVSVACWQGGPGDHGPPSEDF